MQPDPVLVRIGPITIYWYGVLIVTGAMLAAHIASKLSSRNGHNPEIAWNLLIVVLVTGILGARIYHIFSSWEYYRAHPGEMFGLQMSGFGIYGAVAGGTLGVWAFARHYDLRFLEWADYIAPGLILAQAIGRWGNFFNQEVFGPPTDLPWGIYIPPARRTLGNVPDWYAQYEHFHPTFFYESALCLVGFLTLYYLARNWREGRLHGDLFFLYGIIYPTIRFFMEAFFRPDAWTIDGIRVAQVISALCVLFFASLMLIRRKLKRPEMIYEPGTPWRLPEETEEQQGSSQT